MNLESYSSSMSLEHLEIPLLIVHDKDDKETPFVYSKDLHKIANNSELLLTSGLGHYRILRDSKTVTTYCSIYKSTPMKFILLFSHVFSVLFTVKTQKLPMHQLKTYLAKRQMPNGKPNSTTMPIMYCVKRVPKDHFQDLYNNHYEQGYIQMCRL